MLNSAKKRRLALAVAATAMLGSAIMASSANADPKQLSAFVGVGSDTIQDVTNAFAGTTNGIYYTPIHSSVASGAKQVISFDALPPAGVADTCITAKLGGPTFNRPQGSSAGRRALSRALDGTGYGNATCGGPVNVSGQVDFARSSAGPAAGDTGTLLTYVPFARDAVSFATYRANGAAVTTLTRAQLTQLFTTGPAVIGGVRIVPCGIQTSSGTYSFWQGVTTATAGQEDSSTSECNNLLGVGVRAEENDGAALKARGDALAAIPANANDQVIIGFSAGAFIAKSNLKAPGAPPAGVQIGSISDNGSAVNLGSPVSGTAPNLVPSNTFYADSVFGRYVYNVLPTSKIASAFGNDDLKTLFSGPTSAVCQQTSTIQAFGFQTIANCGDITTTKGSYISGQL